MSRLTLLLMLTLCCLICNAEDGTLLTVGSTGVTAEEYTRYLRQSSHGSFDDYILYRLKVEDATSAGLDTTTAFRQHCKTLEGKAIRAFAERQARHPLQAVPQHHEADISRQTILLSVATLRLPQSARLREERLALERMDTLLAVIRERGGEFFETDGVEVNVSKPYPVAGLLKEFVAQIGRLSVGQISEPFISPFGVHIIKVEGQPVEQEMSSEPLRFNPDVLADPNLRALLKEVREGLLAVFWDETHRLALPTDEQMDAYFSLHRDDYLWELPHYKGAVITCVDKKMASQIKKTLKKIPVGQWQEVALSHPEWNAEMEAGLFRIGDNPVIDYKAFKCGDGVQETSGKYTFIMGKKLDKGPDDYSDVHEQVLRDYLKSEQTRQMQELKEKYKVEINQDVLKTVNSYVCK